MLENQRLENEITSMKRLNEDTKNQLEQVRITNYLLTLWL